MFLARIAIPRFLPVPTASSSCSLELCIPIGSLSAVDNSILIEEVTLRTSAVQRKLSIMHSAPSSRPAVTRLVRRGVGAILWFAVLMFGWTQFGRNFWHEQGGRPALATELWDFLGRSTQTARLQSDRPLTIAIGDPVFEFDPKTGYRQIGYIVGLDAPNQSPTRGVVQSARIVFRGLGPDQLIDRELLYRQTPGDMAWVLRTMLPPERRQMIARQLSRMLQENRGPIIEQLKPIVRDSVRDVVLVLESQLKQAVGRHRDDLRKLGNRYQRELLERELVPLVRAEIWPIVVRRGTPVANEIGLGIWERVSVWRFGWRYLIDLAPLTRQTRFEEEWNRFVQQEAIPELEEHSDDLVDLVRQIVKDVAANTKIRTAFRSNLTSIVDDREFQQIVWKILQDVLSDPQPWREVMDKHWKSEATRAAFQIAVERLEPAAQSIGEQLLGSPDAGITPEFARVLRNRVLLKDQRWFVLRKRTGNRSAPVPTDSSGIPQLTVAFDHPPPGSPFDLSDSDRQGGQNGQQ